MWYHRRGFIRTSFSLYPLPQKASQSGLGNAKHPWGFLKEVQADRRSMLADPNPGQNLMLVFVPPSQLMIIITISIMLNTTISLLYFLLLHIFVITNYSEF